MHTSAIRRVERVLPLMILMMVSNVAAQFDSIPNERPTNTDTFALALDSLLRKEFGDTMKVVRGMEGFGGDARFKTQYAPEEYAADVAQALGQIVVDRASQAAFELLRKKIEKLICKENCTLLPKTCEVLQSLRLQEIATSRQALYSALIADVCSEATVGLDSFMGDAEVIALLRDMIVPLLSRPPGSWDVDHVSIAIEQLVSQYDDSNKSKPVFLGVKAFWCAREAAHMAATGDLKTVNMIKVVQAVNAVMKSPLDDTSAVYRKALQLAMHLHRAATLEKDRQADVRGRLLHATEAMFLTANLLMEDTDAKLKLEVLQALMRAVIDEDINSFVVASGKAFKGFAADSTKRVKSTRAIRFLGAVILYAETYTDSGSTAEQAQAARTRILSSLVLDRDERPGACIFSLGGSLRGGAGSSMPRLRDPNTGKREAKLFFGPSLPLGFGMDVYWTPWKYLPPGLHVELGVLDLGRYMVFEDSQAKVNKPVIADALAPSLTFGPFWGSDYPFFLGVVVSYSPNYSYDETHALQGGAFNIGGTFGIYVPFFDFN